MKKIYILLGMVAMFTSSCEDFLNEEPIDKIGAEQYYTDEAGLTQVLAGVYDPLGSVNLYGNNINVINEVGSDEGYYARSAQTTGVQVYNFDPTNANIAGLWTDLYTGINRANDLIAHIDLPKMDEDKRQQILGEALFLRGYYYFMLVTRFGDVPVRLTPTTSPNGVQIARTPTAQVYAQILKDMKEAEAKVGTSSAIGYPSRVSKTVVQGILARVCLQMAGYPLNDASKYAESLSWSKKVIDSGEHALNITYSTDAAYNSFNETIPSIPANSNNAYRQIFINAAREAYNTKECMWEVEFKGNRADGYFDLGGLGSQIGITMTPSAANSPLYNSIGYCYGFVKGTSRLFNKYDATGKDLRRDWNLTTYTWTINNTTNVATKTAIAKTVQFGRDVAKWRREYELLSPKDKNQTGINFPVLRYSDVLLMFAEAENQVNGPTAAAYEAINQVRRRGYGLPVGIPSLLADFTGLNKATFQQAIEDERMRELCFEGLRRYDLIRWNKFVSTMNSVGAEMAAAPSVSGPLSIGDQRYGKTAGINVTNRNLLFPIPSIEILSNKLITENNPGW
ncbi:RagB/SusD family nutrient uptake outer membrane protein [Flavobacterium daemonense]|uniref:RagB/SusD family nutrient uptake outer membrane protein n=1 Tax=Flavobacterium daemonense TaxID=1393049 RepID=UPI0011863F4F|nr:RagB/SusD family nutrient uptake outer membrane protein [Flavobacterium daemonense]KAF2330658.1 RagB/SusD family nutrient uptake outer membrane protein [Flavobacterium daemonense]